MDNERGEIIIYQTEDGLAKLNVKMHGETVWLSLDQMATLFGRDKSTISRHIRNVFAEGELDHSAVVANFATTAADGKTYQVDYYNLDAFAGAFPVMKDVEVAKNYLNEDELKVLNNLVSGYFDFAEISAIEHRPMHMADYIRQLDSILSSGGRELLKGPGEVSHEAAIEKAHAEYRKYQQKTLSPVEEAYLQSLQDTAKKVGKRRQT